MSETNCVICERPRRYEEWKDGNYCSEFCEHTSDDEKIHYKTMKAGDYGLYPCALCKCIIDDVYEPGMVCGPCGPLKKIEKLKALLRRCAPGDEALRSEIAKALQE